MSASFSFNISDRCDVSVEPTGRKIRLRAVARHEITTVDLTFTPDEARAVAKALRRAARYAT